MLRSTDRMLTTHVGSLPRPADLLAMAAGQKVDQAKYDVRVRQSVADIVKTQAEIGIDIVSDGEMSKPSFITYINERLAGFEIDSAVPNQSPWVGSREDKAFPGVHDRQLTQVHTQQGHSFRNARAK